MAVTFPAFCPACGFIFQSRLLSIGGNVTGLSLEGNKETCPRCGEWADVLEGEFNVVGDTIEVLDASDLNRERLARLQAILDQARNREIDLDEAVEALA